MNRAGLAFGDTVELRAPLAAPRGLCIDALAARSARGTRRDHNEDAVLVCPPLLAIADGVGGAPAGERAAALVIEALRREVPAHPADPERALAAALAHANVAVRAALPGAAATVVAALLAGERLSVAHAGDSRAYLWRGGSLTALTRDHAVSAVGEPRRRAVLRAVGARPRLVVDVATLRLRAGDIVLLCSDGLTDPLEDEVLAALIADEPDIDLLVRRLAAAALDASGGDDLSVLAARLG